MSGLTASRLESLEGLIDMIGTQPSEAQTLCQFTLNIDDTPSARQALNPDHSRLILPMSTAQYCGPL